MNHYPLNRMLAFRRVLVLRPDNLGDVVLFSGVFRYIRECYPQSRIVLCVKKAVRNLVEHCPYIDKIITWESLVDPLLSINSFPSEFKGAWRLNRMAGHFRCLLMKSDVVLLPVRSPTAGLKGMHYIVNLIPAKEKIGISGDFCNQSPGEDIKAASYYTHRLKLAQNQKEDHELSITREFLKFLGKEINLDCLWPEFWIDRADQIWAERMIPLKVPGKTILAFAPGVTSFSGKFYTGKKYAQALSLLSDKFFHIVIFGSKAEKSMCDEVESALKGLNNVKAITNLAGKTTIRQLIECLRLCDLLISLETAAMHIGVALRKPTIGILGGGHYGRFYPWGNPEINKVVNFPMACYWCNWNCAYSTARCIDQIKPDMIAVEIRKVLKFMHYSEKKDLQPILVS